MELILMIALVLGFVVGVLGALSFIALAATGVLQMLTWTMNGVCEYSALLAAYRLVRRRRKRLTHFVLENR